MEYFFDFLDLPNNKRDFNLFFMDGGVSGSVARGDENATFRLKKVGVPLTHKSKRWG